MTTPFFRDRFTITKLSLEQNKEIEFDYGTLMNEGKYDIKMLKDLTFSSKQIFIFRELIVICHDSKGTQEYRTWKAFRTRDYRSIEKDKSVVTFVAYNKDVTKNAQKSFQIKLKQEHIAEALKVELSKLFEPTTSPFHKTESGSPVDGQRFHIGSNKKAHQQPHCGWCSKLLKGRFTVGIICKACNKFFHEECFQKSKHPVS